MPRHREKACDHCQQIATALFRLQVSQAQDWQLICRSCYDQVLVDHPDARYGGTWKAKKRQ